MIKNSTCIIHSQLIFFNNLCKNYTCKEVLNFVMILILPLKFCKKIIQIENYTSNFLRLQNREMILLLFVPKLKTDVFKRVFTSSSDVFGLIQVENYTSIFLYGTCFNISSCFYATRSEEFDTPF